MSAETATDAGDMAQRIAEAAQNVPGVLGLDSGRFGEVATYLPGGRVRGVRIADGRSEVHIIAELGRELPAVADEVRQAATEITGLPCDVTVEDVRLSEPPAVVEADTKEDG